MPRRKRRAPVPLETGVTAVTQRCVRAAVRDALPGDDLVVSAMLARAFADDPAMSYIFPDPVIRISRLPRLFRLLYVSDGHRGLRIVTNGTEAATLWRAPGDATVGWREKLAELVPLASAIGPAFGRALAVSSAIERHMPRDITFWYLHIAGCDPVHQGKGLGSSAIRAGLARADAEGLPAYLETATETNLGLYQRLGFRVTGEWRVGKLGPIFWSMLRAANPPIAA